VDPAFRGSSVSTFGRAFWDVFGGAKKRHLVYSAANAGTTVWAESALVDEFGGGEHIIDGSPLRSITLRRMGSDHSPRRTFFPEPGAVRWWRRVAP